ncbi:helix-turn-helix domain-containing protein [Microbacterium sp. P07]|uniref:helix-turn-helix domain-containing protein n=1 Tax=Microbacterium sp. P07 TaxID=3366952 RepID=UPI003746C0AF
MPETPTDDAFIGQSLGRAIREARTTRKLSMRALATAADISQPFLSTIENGQTMPSLATLYRIAKVLGISPSELLPAMPEPEVIHLSRADGGPWAPIADVVNAGTHRVISSADARGATVQEYRIEPGQYMGDWFESDGDLTVYVVAGRITVTIEGRGEWELGAGDAIAHPGALRNRWSVVGDDPVRIVLVYAVGDRKP